MTAMIIFFFILFFIDLYVFQPFRILLKKLNGKWQKIASIVYWAIPFSILILAIFYQFDWTFLTSRRIRGAMMALGFVNYVPKLFTTLFLLATDTLGILQWTFKKFVARREKRQFAGKPIKRSEFISKMAVASAGIPFALMGFGIVKGAHDYEVRRSKIVLPNLPKAFHGVKLAQISDIHSGSFFNKTAVKGGVDLLLQEKPDIAFFTGDLVNNETRELNQYFDIFNKVEAPLGVYSVTGNHDYGMYSKWPSKEAKDKNFRDFIEAHKRLGYDLLLNEHRKIIVDGESIAVLGVENWGTGRFPKFGKLDKALEGTEEFPVKILMSHDPSHWDAQVKGKTDIDLMLAGHTHGMQFGVEIGDFRWSPIKYGYKQWADLYQEQEQYLYVNRGYGYLGYPGRVGITPEITIIELLRA